MSGTATIAEGKAKVRGVAPDSAEFLRLSTESLQTSKTGNIGNAVFDVAPELWLQWADTCDRRGVNVDSLLLSGLIAVLCRATDAREIALQFAHGTGDSTSLIPLTISLADNMTFDDLWSAVRQESGLSVKRGAWIDSPQPGAVFPLFAGAQTSLPWPEPTDASPIAFGYGARSSFQVFFAKDRYRQEEAERLLLWWARLLTSATDDGSVAVEELVLTSPEERQALLQACAGPLLDLGSFEPVYTGILKRAQSHPDRVAVVCDDRSMTYRQLVQRAFAIAEQMLGEGVEAGQRVALCLSRTTDMPATLLAVLLCGCTYVPLDPLFPLERMTAVLADADAVCMLTDGTATTPNGVRLLDLRTMPDEPVGALLSVSVREEDAAYIIYTSGSTGKPKGVVIGHGALRSLLCAAQQTPGFTENDVLVAITTLTFDISVMDMWLPLFTGARLVIATYEESRNPPMLEALLNRNQATLLEATPGLWRALVEHGWTTHAQGAAPVRVLCGGEAMSRDLADLLLTRATEVWNMYGPTECTVWISATRVKPGTTAAPVDCALPNARMLVVDRALQPVPAGITGELVLTGPNVGMGYWNKPELTAKAFVANPFGPGLLYRTGDLAQMQPGGGLRLLGRVDFQVKVRGFRIELGEIEHVLAQHPAVREAVVVQQTLAAENGGPVSKPLVAFVDVGRTFAQADYDMLVRELDAKLRGALPEYMVPAGIVVLPELPRLFNQKVDRKTLPAFTPTSAKVPEQHYVAPRDFLERQLAGIWQMTLGIDRVGIETSYFALGADSLTALRLINRINSTFAMQLGLANLLTSDSIAAMAQLIRDHHKPNVDRALVPLRTGGSRLPLFLIHGVGGNILNFTGLAAQLDAEQPVYALQAQALLTGQAALLRMEDLAAYYLREIRSVQPHGPYRLLGYSFGGTLAAEMARQLRAADETVDMLGILDARTRSFELAHRESMGSHAVQNDFRRLAGNTRTLSKRERLRYIVGKLGTRSVRYLAAAFHRAGLRTMPSFLKVAWDINLVALRLYQPGVFEGRLVLFRAKQQDFTNGPRDLGWGALFPEGIEIREIDSDHERIFLQPALGQLAAQITAVLQAADRIDRLEETA